MKEFYSELDNSKININWNKKPVKMELFLSFLTVDVERSTSHLGYCNGWTQIKGDNGLEIAGGEVVGVEYLDSIKYGNNLDNPYNDYVNPFYLFEIFTKEGKEYFIKYYSRDIDEVLKKAKLTAERARINAEKAEAHKVKVVDFWQYKVLTKET